MNFFVYVCMHVTLFHRPSYKVLNYDNQLWHAEDNKSLQESLCYEVHFNI